MSLLLMFFLLRTSDGRLQPCLKTYPGLLPCNSSDPHTGLQRQKIFSQDSGPLAFLVPSTLKVTQQWI